TFASMSHTIQFEDWPDDDRPMTAASFCSVLSEESFEASNALDVVRSNAVRFLRERAGRLWPRVEPGDFQGSATDAQYWRAHTDPSDRYVQALPGTDSLRLRAAGRGFTHLFPAGDWTE